ncbi:hypothetical protein BDB01DRAFT_846430 [Pilobolus umbonatus]|nr:hypothetical protein BDB01DRAFT_846430 [Pilobolus umbonatus]
MRTEYKEEEPVKENITYEFQSIEHLDSIKAVIVDRCKKRMSIRKKEDRMEQHFSGLPSPPIEDKKDDTELIEVKKEDTLTCDEIQAKIDELKEEKHRLFQVIKQLMLEEEKKKRERLSQQEEERKQLKERQVVPPAVPVIAEDRKSSYEYNNRQNVNNKRKTRWAPMDHPMAPSPFYSSHSSSYYHPRSSIPSRYKSNYSYLPQPRRYAFTRPPYSR